MEAVIIRKKDVERLGKEVLKEVYKFLHNEYILTNFEEMKKVKHKFLRNLVFNKFRSSNITIKRIEYENFDENKFEDEIKCLEDEIKNGSISTEIIFQTLNDLDLDMELDGDLYYKQDSFLDIYKVFKTGYIYLKD